ncbi:DUF5819 family protein [Peterkaempfera sp. SMS 1(5)a]|uniref:DUF5819 family protein n=1 Tax=Peterkaempfera podocarpi TaxID=3232308 RepID=UPI003670F004
MMEQPSSGEPDESAAAHDDGAVSEDTPPPAGNAEPPATAAGRTWSTPAQAALSLAAVLVIAGTVWHLGAVFLHVAPSNSISQRYQKQVDAWVYPEFEQNWKLFAPNPLQQNIAVDARVTTLGSDGSHHVGEWVGLTAQDVSGIRHNPAPGHVDQNLLRRAWDVYNGGQSGDLFQRYLKRIALQRIGRQWHGEQIIQVQLRAGTANVAPPSWSSERWSTEPTYRELEWWPVTDQDYVGL